MSVTSGNNGPSSVCVEVQNRNSALREMEKAFHDESGMISKYVFFPLDNRVFDFLRTSYPNYKDLAEATIVAFKKSAAFEPTAVDKFLNEARYLSVVLLVTRDGMLFAINNNKELHTRLREYTELLKYKCSGKCTNMTGPDCEGMCYFEDTDEGFEQVDPDFAILFMARFVHDKTHLRRARKILTLGCYTYFLELDTAIVRRMCNDNCYETYEQKERFFSHPSCISQYKLEGGNETEAKGILLETLSISYTNKMTVLFHEHVSGDKWLPVVTPFVEPSSTLFVQPLAVYDQAKTSYVEPVNESNSGISTNTTRKRTANGEINTQ